MKRTKTPAKRKKLKKEVKVEEEETVEEEEEEEEEEECDVLETKERVKRAMKQLKTPFNVACGGEATQLPAQPGLTITDIGVVSLPITQPTAKEIIKVARRAPYGKGSKTVVDTKVRDSTSSCSTRRVAISFLTKTPRRRRACSPPW